MKTVNAYDVVTTLITKATALQSTLNDAANKVAVDEKSDHTWYGVPETVIEDLQEAIDLVNLAANKVNTVIAPNTVV
jgi:hypothetical protein